MLIIKNAMAEKGSGKSAILPKSLKLLNCDGRKTWQKKLFDKLGLALYFKKTDRSNKLEKKMTAKTYWTYETNGTIFDLEFDTMQEALDFAEKKFVEECEDYEIDHDDELDFFLVEVSFNEENGDREEIKRVKTVVSYEYYHGDLKEHGTWN